MNDNLALITFQYIQHRLRTLEEELVIHRAAVKLKLSYIPIPVYRKYIESLRDTRRSGNVALGDLRVRLKRNDAANLVCPSCGTHTYKDQCCFNWECEEFEIVGVPLDKWQKRERVLS